MRFAEQVFAAGAYELLANRNYPAQNVPAFKGPDSDICDSIKRNPALFIRGPFTKQVCLRAISHGEYAGTFVIDAFSDGPLIQLTFPKLVRNDGAVYLIQGDLYLPPHLFITDESKRERPSEEAREAFKRIKKALLVSLTPVRTSRGTLHFGESALQHAREGVALRIDGAPMLLKELLSARPASRLQ